MEPSGNGYSNRKPGWPMTKWLLMKLPTVLSPFPYPHFIFMVLLIPSARMHFLRFQPSGQVAVKNISETFNTKVQMN